MGRICKIGFEKPKDVLMISKKSRKSSHLDEVGCNCPELSRKILVLDDELVEG